MPDMPERENEPKHSSHGFEDHESAHHQLSPAEIAQANATSMSNEASEIRKGNAAANQSVLSEVHQMQKGGYLAETAKDLEKSGDAKVTYGSDGQVQHILFTAKDGSAPVDVDVQNDKINGKSATEIRAASAEQSKEYIAASLADPKVTDNTGKPLSPEAQAAANQLMGAFLDGNVEAMTKAAQEIMKNPAMAKSIGSIIDRVSLPSPIKFGTDDKGQPYMATRTGSNDTVVVPASGQARAVGTDYLGNPDFSKPADLNKAMKSASDQALYESSGAIKSAEGYLSLADRLPADGYLNMKSLEHEYRKDDPLDTPIIAAKTAREIMKLTPEEQEQVLGKKIKEERD